MFFKIAPVAPAEKTRDNSSDVPKDVRMRILVSGSLERISVVASTPPILGITKSMTMTSGFSFMAFDTAMLPLLASPTISKSGMLHQFGNLIAQNIIIDYLRKALYHSTPCCLGVHLCIRSFVAKPNYARH